MIHTMIKGFDFFEHEVATKPPWTVLRCVGKHPVRLNSDSYPAVLRQEARLGLEHWHHRLGTRSVALGFHENETSLETTTTMTRKF